MVLGSAAAVGEVDTGSVFASFSSTAVVLIESISVLIESISTVDERNAGSLFELASSTTVVLDSVSTIGEVNTGSALELCWPLMLGSG